MRVVASGSVGSEPGTARLGSANANKGLLCSRRGEFSLIANARLDRTMAAVKGRKQRRGVSHAVQLNARVLPDRREKALRAAEALGISVNAYIDALLDREQLDERGRPLWWDSPVPTDQEELPLKTSA